MNALRLWTIAGAACALTSCEAINDYPVCEDTVPVIVRCHVAHAVPPMIYKVLDYDSRWTPTVTEVAPMVPSDDHYVPFASNARVLVDLFSSEGGATDTDPAGRGPLKLLSHRSMEIDPAAENVTDTLRYELLPGHYTFLSWSDMSLTDQPGFDASDMTGVLADVERHPLEVNYRSGLAGDITIFVPEPEVFPTPPVEVDLWLYRPMARYRVVATDLAALDIPLDRILAKVVYRQYVSVGFNVSTRQPNAFLTSYSFDTPLRPVVSTKGSGSVPDQLSILADYIFTASGTEEYVVADFHFFDLADGRRISSVEGLEIPLRQDCETILRGPFLSRPKIDSGGDVNIDDRFEGEIVVPIQS